MSFWDDVFSTARRTIDRLENAIAEEIDVSNDLFKENDELAEQLHNANMALKFLLDGEVSKQFVITPSKANFLSQYNVRVKFNEANSSGIVWLERVDD